MSTYLTDEAVMRCLNQCSKFQPFYRRPPIQSPLDWFSLPKCALNRPSSADSSYQWDIHWIGNHQKMCEEKVLFLKGQFKLCKASSKWNRVSSKRILGQFIFWRISGTGLIPNKDIYIDLDEYQNMYVQLMSNIILVEDTPVFPCLFWLQIWLWQPGNHVRWYTIHRCVSQYVAEYVVSLTQCMLNGDFNARQGNDCVKRTPDYCSVQESRGSPVLVWWGMA